MTHFDQKKYYDYLHRFERMSDDELMSVVDRESGHNGVVASRMAYMRALQQVFEKRGLNYGEAFAAAKRAREEANVTPMNTNDKKRSRSTWLLVMVLGIILMAVGLVIPDAGTITDLMIVGGFVLAVVGFSKRGGNINLFKR